WIDEAAEQIELDDFVDPAYREIFRALLEDPDLRQVPVGMDPVAARTMEELLADAREVTHTRQVFQETVNRIRRKPLDQRAEELRALLRKAEEAGDEERVHTLMDELSSLARERREMGEGWESAAQKALRVSRATEDERGR
ncbi:MAG TPA: hypothetical protein VLL48_09060, partial [Longimicrobiales bacterium]|nr:hypothetical protein [Longimicrobiales bacterium]